MGDSDVDEAFTFGSFTLEDTQEFKKNYADATKHDKSAKMSSSSDGHASAPAPASGPSASPPVVVAAADARDPPPQSSPPALPTPLPPAAVNLPATSVWGTGGSASVAAAAETETVTPAVGVADGKEDVAVASDKKVAVVSDEKVAVVSDEKVAVVSDEKVAVVSGKKESKAVLAVAEASPASGASTPSPPPKAAAAMLSRPKPMSWASIAAGRPKPPPPAPAPAPARVSKSTNTGVPRPTQALPESTAAAEAQGRNAGSAGGKSQSDVAAAKSTGRPPSGVFRGEGGEQRRPEGDKRGDEEGGEKGLDGERSVSGAVTGAGASSSSSSSSPPPPTPSPSSSSRSTEIGSTGVPAQAAAATEPEAAVAAGVTAEAPATVDPVAAEAARAEAEARAAEEAKAKDERTWKALLGMLGREEGAVASADLGVLGGARPTTLGDLVHRGLVNTGNSCFRSSVLQALLACEPFVGVLFRAVPGLRDSSVAQEAMPTWAQFARFASAFEPPKPGATAPLGAGGGRAGRGAGGGWSTPASRSRGGRQTRGPGAPEPVLPDEAMSRAFGAFRSANTGEQEDAQEFLAFFLDQLHEEIVKAKKLHQSQGGPQGSSTGSAAGGGGGGGTATAAAEEDSWLEVGKGGSKAVVNGPDPRRQVSNSSVVTGLFYGMFRSEVKKGGSSTSSVTLEPFHCLQLDLDPPASSQTNNNPNSNSAEGASAGPSWGSANGSGSETANGAPGRGAGRGPWGSSGVGRGGGAWGGAGMVPAPGTGATVLEDALAALFGGEAVAGVKGRKNREVSASRTLTLERAPKVLTLHLKQFSFHPELGPRKLARRVRYPLELEVPKKIMSPSLLHEASKRGPLKYRLFTVVLHHGRSLHGGHYTALVRGPRGEWRHCDDQHLTPETEGHALNPMNGHPYLLLYTRI